MGGKRSGSTFRPDNTGDGSQYATTLYDTGTQTTSERAGRAGEPRHPICLTQSGMTPLHGGGFGTSWSGGCIAMRAHSGSASATGLALVKPNACAAGVACVV